MVLPDPLYDELIVGQTRIRILLIRLYPQRQWKRRLEDKIQELCDQLVATDDARESVQLSSKLREALKEHLQRLRSQILVYPPGKDRRSS